ncbi:MAG TPA: tRNA guanosine(34) transglycosylase Tgt [Gemmatimonadaceae bacterium]
MFSYEIHATEGRARAGSFRTPRGVVETPLFMPVGTLATVKALDPDELLGMNAQMILANAYHLHLRPGDELVRSLGGVHRFMGWHGPVLTDSGGFQVFSLASLNKVNEDGVTFRSHIDGSERHFTPESVMRIETNLGADVIMQFDHVIPGQSDEAAARDASERSIRWLTRCRAEFDVLHAAADAPRQTLFPILQGGIHPGLRHEAALRIAAMHRWDGFAIGGLSVGEAKPDMYAMIEVCDAVIPADRPRYLMGVGYPEDLLEGVARGIDMFDCVAPTRMGRNAAALTSDGRVNMRRAEFRADDRPVVEGCGCACCRRFSRAYVRHLVQADEMLGARLLSLHNVHFLIALMREARSRIIAGEFASWSRDWLARYLSKSTSQ